MAAAAWKTAPPQATPDERDGFRSNRALFLLYQGGAARELHRDDEAQRLTREARDALRDLAKNATTAQGRSVAHDTLACLTQRGQGCTDTAFSFYVGR
jgi:hypothetical protein